MTSPPFTQRMDLVKMTKGNILIVDDSPNNLQVLSSTLIQQDYKVRCATNGERALVSISNGLPDLILLDIWMPNMNGYELCELIKANSQTSDIPIIFLSALDEVVDKVKAFSMGAVDYITKPFQTEEVLARIEHQLTIKHLRQQLIERNQQLQQKIDEQKRIEIALKDAKEAAEAANYAKSEFLSRMSHDLRTPLNAILGFSSLMHGDTSIPTKYQDYVRAISDSGQHLLKLINNILSVTNSESSKLSLHEACFDLSALLDTLKTIEHKGNTFKSVRIAIEYTSEVPRFIYADESKLRQVLLNLLENAIQSTHRGMISLRVGISEWENQSINGAGFSSYPVILCFEVKDHGLGMDSAEINSLLQEFPKTTIEQKAGRGIGMGLLISRQFVQLMGGDIAIASTIGQGTTVRFHIRAHLVPPHSGFTPLTTAIAKGSLASTAQPQPLGQDASLEVLQTIMPVKWFIQLHTAAIKGFDHQILQLIQDIPATHTLYARPLITLTRDFQFDQIVRLTQPLVERNNDAISGKDLSFNSIQSANCSSNLDNTR